ncbi:MAG: hypothetical protein KY458_14540 [Actinobacteria bacterium]|nr:hypothetical protein [Actinomycetota bacterium]
MSALVAVAGACSSGGEDGSAGRFGAVHQNVCAAAAAARADDHSSAQRRFSDAHSGLHDLADAVEEHDRRAAAALLEAKQRAEAALGEPSPPTRELTDLADAVGGAIAAIGAEPSPRCSP